MTESSEANLSEIKHDYPLEFYSRMIGGVYKSLHESLHESISESVDNMSSSLEGAFQESLQNSQLLREATASLDTLLNNNLKKIHIKTKLRNYTNSPIVDAIHNSDTLSSALATCDWKSVITICDWLLEHDTKLGKDKFLESLAADAIVNDNIEIIHYAITRAGTYEFDSDYLLDIALTNGKLDTVKWLISRYHIDMSLKMANSQYSLIRASAEGYLDIVKWLCENYSISPKTVIEAFKQSHSYKDNALKVNVTKYLYEKYKSLLEGKTFSSIFSITFFSYNFEHAQWLLDRNLVPNDDWEYVLSQICLFKPIEEIHEKALNFVLGHLDHANPQISSLIEKNFQNTIIMGKEKLSLIFLKRYKFLRCIIRNEINVRQQLLQKCNE